MPDKPNIEASLRDAALAADAGQDFTLLDAEPATTGDRHPDLASPEVEPSDSPETESAENPDNDANPDPDSRPEASEPKGEENSEGTEKRDKSEKSEKSEKPESPYDKAKKERERRERSWQRLEEEKKSLQAAREAWQREQQSRSPVEELQDEHGYTVPEYEAAAKEFEASQNPVLATQCRERAQALAQRGGQEQHRSHWVGHMESTIRSMPELGDKDHPLSKSVATLLQEEPLFSHIPDGFSKAVAVARWKGDAESLPALRTEVQRLKTEIERLNRATSLSGSGPTSQPKAKSLDDLSSADAERELRRMAAEADAH